MVLLGDLLGCVGEGHVYGTELWRQAIAIAKKAPRQASNTAGKIAFGISVIWQCAHEDSTPIEMIKRGAAKNKSREEIPLSKWGLVAHADRMW